MSFTKNFIKQLPEEYDMAIDESLLILQVRVRKGMSCEKSLRKWIKEQEKVFKMNCIYKQMEDHEGK